MSVTRVTHSFSRRRIVGSAEEEEILRLDIGEQTWEFAAEADAGRLCEWVSRTTASGDIRFRPESEDAEDVVLAALTAVATKPTGKWILKHWPDDKEFPAFVGAELRAWDRTVYKVKFQSGLDPDQWSGKQYAAAKRIYTATVNKYGDDVPEDY